ncbi:MAG: hypothetical protein OXO51_15905 [Gemmatimonadota bacterium]|nr:hypothetical protein [Gemmatimonadota bacterium]
MAKFRRTVLVFSLIILPSTAVAQDDLDLRTAVTVLIIHSDVKTAFAEKAFEVALRRLCVLCDAKPAYVASLLISMHKDVREKGLDKKFIPVVMNYNRIVGTVESTYLKRKLPIESRSELCKTLAAMYMTVRPETRTSAEAVEDIIEGYAVFLGKP